MVDQTVSYPGKSVYDNCTHIKQGSFYILIAQKDFSVATVSGRAQSVPADAQLMDLGTANGYSLKEIPNGSKMDVNGDSKPDVIFATRDGELFAILAK